MLRDALVTPPPGRVYPAVRLAVTVAVIVTASPQLSRPLRRAGRWVTLVGAVAGLPLGYYLPLGLLAGVALGMGGAALVHLAFGSPGGRVPLALVRAELDELGLPIEDLQHAPFEPRGVAIATARTADGRPLLVKIYGRDAWEGSLFASAWTSLWYRDGAPVTQVSRQRQVEHEAYLTLLAERAGVPVQPVLAAGLAWGADALLVRRDDGRRLVDVPGREVTAELLAGYWAALRRLHATGIAHGRIHPRTLVVRDDGTACLTGLDAGTTSPEPGQRHADTAQLLVSLAARVGPDAAVASALAALGPDGLAATVPYVQPAVLDAELRRAVKSGAWSLADLRRVAVAASGVPEPKLQQLRRVSVGSLVMVALLIVVAYTLISALSGVGLDTIVEQFRGARWGWVAAAVLVSPTIQVGQALATLGASPRPLRFGPVLALQYAMQFVGLAVPSSAGRLALEIRFFQLAGTNATGAVAIGVIDTVGGLVVQALVIALTLLTGIVTLNVGDTSSSSSSGESGAVRSALAGVDWLTVGIITALVLGLAVVLVLAVPRLRSFLRSRLADSRAALGVLRSPRKIALILAGAVTWNVLAAVVLGCSTRAFGLHATFAELILVNTLVALFAGIMPIPGNIGVSEAALTWGLVALGFPQAAALSAAIVYRLATFYLPPIWGYAALRGLRRHGYL